MAPSQAIAGLGNPGPRYVNTPHSAGFEVVDALAARWRATEWKPWKRLAAVAEAQVDGELILLVKPATYMNLSGEAVVPLLSYRGLDETHLTVVCDDIALPVGRTRLRAEGSSGGQKGLQSIIDHLGTAQFSRLRLGVAPSEEGLPCEAERWVLSKWSPRLRRHFDSAIDQAVECLEMMLSEGIEPAMGGFNGRCVPDPDAPPDSRE
jgi:peptidyl-tRNA hydrolase, PTH1 family